MLKRLCLLLLASLSLSAGQVQVFRGADIPWTTYEAETMRTSGQILEPAYGPGQIQMESSGLRCVKLAAGDYLEFTSTGAANAIVVRYCLPDAAKGGGVDSEIRLFKNGKFIRQVPLTSRYSWLYGKYPFTNDPQAGIPRNFYDEVRLKNLSIDKGDIVRLEKEPGDTAAYCIIDLVDFETVAPPLPEPNHSISLRDARFGAAGDGNADDTDALRKCIKAAQASGRSVWIPPGTYKISGDIDLPDQVTLQGAGMWHAEFVGDSACYSDFHRRIRFNGRGGGIRLADFAILGCLDHRSDSEPNDGITGSFGANSTISRIWVEHTKTGIWAMNSSNLVVEGCRFRDTIADGANFCVGMRNSTITNCTARGTGDDCFAIWPAVYTAQQYAPGFNTIIRCSAQTPFLANGAAIYGGEANRVENSSFVDIASGCGILISSTFPTEDSDRGVDNNFSGTTVVRRCNLLRCGGYDHEWAWRAALQLCLHRRSISGVSISELNIKDSISDGFSVIAPGAQRGQNELSRAQVANLNIPNYGLGTPHCHAFWIGGDARGRLNLVNSSIAEITNNSPAFVITQSASSADEPVGGPRVMEAGVVPDP